MWANCSPVAIGRFTFSRTRRSESGLSGRIGVLVEVEPERLERLSEVGRLGGREHRVGVEQEVDSVTEGHAKCLGRRDRPDDRGLRIPLPETSLVERRERPEAEGGEAELLPAEAVLDELLGGGTREMPVDPDALTRRAAEEVVDRCSEPLPLEIPERDVDPGDGAHDHLAGRPERAPHHLAPPVLDPAGILADEQLLEVVEDAEHAATPAGEARLADSRQALVGPDENDDHRVVVARTDAHR